MAGNRRRRGGMACAAIVGSLAYALLVPSGVRAQVAPRLDVLGIVVDSLTGEPVAGASVRLLTGQHGAVSGPDGRFVLELPVARSYAIEVEQFGYSKASRLFRPPPAGELLWVALQPRPVELEGFDVRVRGQLERRRFLAATHVEVVTAAEIGEKGGAGIELLHRLMPLTRVCYDPDGELCFGSPRKKTRVTMCIDEQPAFEGISDFERIRPWEIHSIELFNSGRHVRVYTREFMQRVMDGREKIQPLAWCIVPNPGAA